VESPDEWRFRASYEQDLDLPLAQGAFLTSQEFLFLGSSEDHLPVRGRAVLGGLVVVHGLKCRHAEILPDKRRRDSLRSSPDTHPGRTGSG
jgi:hypothetical protein